VLPGAEPKPYLVDKVCDASLCHSSIYLYAAHVDPAVGQTLHLYRMADQALLALQFFGSEIMSSSESRQKRINEVISTYQRDPADTGSTEVQGRPGT